MAESLQQAAAPDVPAQGVAEQEVYVGPRPFERAERGLFFGRDREISELLSLVISSRVVLCYAPSGAGKTSLINAGLHPRLDQEDFEVLPPARVRGLVPEGIDEAQVPNLYMFNALLSLAGEEGAPDELAVRTLEEFLATRPHQDDEEGFPAPRLLTFDQFEELLTSYPERWQERDGFFQQVYDALQADPLLRVLFVMREDFLARMEPYMRLLKPFPLARFRLPLLGPEGAHAAVTGPLRATDRHFQEGVAERLVEELRKVRVETAQGEAVEVGGEYVEPVQLQVVCRNLWTGLPPEVKEISLEHLETYGDVDQALQGFYESCVAQARTSQDANELRLREWFETQLITPAGTRGIVFRDARLTAGLPNPVVDFLENRHLIRGEWRAGSRWYELTHDRFIEPIQGANRRWREGRQTRRNRWVFAVALPLLLALLLSASFFAALQTTAQPGSQETAVAAATIVSVATVGAQEALQDVAISKSQQLAAEALAVSDPDLALLLAVEANRQSNTQEARRSLQNILSSQPVPDGKFLTVFYPEVISPNARTSVEGWVASVAFSPDGQRLAFGSADATVVLLDVTTGEPAGSPLVGHTSIVQSVAFSPNGTLLASGSLDGQILLWFASTGQQVASLQGHTGLVTSVAFSPDGNLLASGGEDGSIIIWDVVTGRSIEKVEGHKAAVWTVAWSPDGTYLASGGADSSVQLWNAKTFNPVRTLTGHRGLVRSLAWSPDGRSLASGSVTEERGQASGEVILWEVSTGTVIARPFGENNLPARTIAFHPNGAILAIGRDDGAITLWDIRNQQALGDPVQAHDHRVQSIAFSPDGRTMASGSVDETVVLWDFFTYTRSMAFNPEGSYVASGSEDNTVRVWETATGDEIARMSHDGVVTSVAFSPDGEYVLSGSGDNTIRLWEIASEKEIARVSTGSVTAVAFSPDGRVVLSGSWDNIAQAWEIETGRELARMAHEDVVNAVAFSPDGRYALSGGDTTARVWETTTGKEIARMTHQDVVTSVAFSPDGRYALSGSWDHTARVWEVATGKEVARITHDDVVLTVAFSPDGKFIVTGSWDSAVSIWEVATGTKIAALSIPSEWVTGLNFYQEGRILAIGMESGSVLLWDLGLLDASTNLEPYLELACSRVKRNLKISEWSKYFRNEPYRATCPNVTSPPEDTELGTPDDKLVAAKTWDLVLQEPFDDNDNQWTLWNYDQERRTVTTLIDQGLLRVRLQSKQASVSHWEIAPLSSYADLYLAVKAHRIGIPAEGGNRAVWGLVFRRQGDDYYLLLLNDVQEYVLYLHQGDQWITLLGPTRSNLINIERSNEIAVVADGSDIVISINGAAIDRIEDSNLTAGNVGIYVGVYTQGGDVTFEFDDFELRQKP